MCKTNPGDPVNLKNALYNLSQSEERNFNNLTSTLSCKEMDNLTIFSCCVVHPSNKFAVLSSISVKEWTHKVLATIPGTD